MDSSFETIVSGTVQEMNHSAFYLTPAEESLEFVHHCFPKETDLTGVSPRCRLSANAVIKEMLTEIRSSLFYSICRMTVILFTQGYLPFSEPD